MLTDKDTVQIKALILEYDCTRDHNNRLVKTNWKPRNYLEQFRVDHSWKITAIVQAVKSNHKVDISRLISYRAKYIAYR